MWDLKLLVGGFQGFFIKILVANSLAVSGMFVEIP